MVLSIDLPYSPGHFEGILRGIHSEAQLFPEVKLNWLGGVMRDEALDLNGAHQPAGVISSGYNHYLVDDLQRFGKPVIICSSMYPDLEGKGLRTCSYRNEEVGRRAAEFLVDRGFTHFAVAHRKGPGHLIRAEAFRARLPGSVDCPMIDAEVSPRDEVLEQFRRLPSPCALFLTADHLGPPVTKLLRELGRLVPDDVALLGVSNNELLCSISSPPLSSVDLLSDEIGRKSLRLLVSWINGSEPPSQFTEVGCGDVVARASTDLIAHPDPVLRHALEIIETGKGTQSPSEVSRTVGCSLRSLQRKFQEQRSQTVKECLTARRVRFVNMAVRDTRRSFAEIAEEAGFPDYFSLANWFKRNTGQTLGEVRRGEGAPQTYR